MERLDRQIAELEISTTTKLLLTTLHPISRSWNCTKRVLGKEECDMISFSLGKISGNVRFAGRE